MQIDMSQATVEWLEEWVKEETKRWSLARHTNIDPYEAHKRYISSKIDIYIQNAQVSRSSVSLHVSSLSLEDLNNLLPVEFILPGGIAKFDSISSEKYHEAYCEDTSARLEVNFSVTRT